MMQTRRIVVAALLCLVMTLALFTTGAFAQSAHTSVSGKAAAAQTVIVHASVAESSWGFGWGGFGGFDGCGCGGFGFGFLPVVLVPVIPFWGGFGFGGFGGWW
jgi:uncharacterized membrane protein